MSDEPEAKPKRDNWRITGRVYTHKSGQTYAWIQMAVGLTRTEGLVTTAGLSQVPDHPYGLTHLATGSHVAGFVTREAAEQAAVALAEVATWTDEIPVTKENGEKVSATITAWGGIRREPHTY